MVSFLRSSDIFLLTPSMLHVADSLLTVQQGVVQRNSSLGKLLEAESTYLSLPITKDKCLSKLQ